MLHISASILACPSFDIKNRVCELADAGIRSIHYDVMDGHYVDQITGDLDLCKSIMDLTTLPVYVHLMVDNPKKQIERFIKSGAYAISFHPICNGVNDLIQFIQSFGVKAGIAVRDEKEIETLSGISGVDLITVMTVKPGLCGQNIDLEKIKNIDKVRSIMPEVQVFVDGGINDKTLHIVRGADAFIMGSYLFGGELKERVKKLEIC